MTQRQINAAHLRSLKTKYTHLNRQEKRLIKLREREHQLEFEIPDIWRDIRRLQPPPYDPESTSERVLDLIDLVVRLTDEAARIRRSKERLIQEYALDEDRIASIHMQCNIAPGGSF